MSSRSEKSIRNKSRFAACFVVLLLLTLLCLSLTSCSCFSSEIVIKQLDIRLDLQEDGKTYFTETSRAAFSDQDSKWWNYYRLIDDEDLLEKMEEDPSAFEIVGDSFRVDGTPIEFVGAIDLSAPGAKATYTALYSDRPVGYFFVRTSGKDKGIEIGVILPSFRSGTRTISYQYAIKGLVSGIADEAVFYYKYVSESNSMDIEKMSVTVNFPVEEGNLRSWLHVSGNAEGAWKQSADKKSVSILAEDISAGEYVESRMLLGKSHYALYSTDPLVTSVDIENEEADWKAAYDRKKNIYLAITILDYVLGALSLGLGVLFIFILKRKNRPLDLPDKPLYYRDIPEGYTGGEVSPLYFYYSNENYLDESISATMLELVRLRYITIAPDEKKKNAVITVLKQDEEDALRTHQKYVIEMLLAVKPLGTSFTMKEFESFGKSNPDRIMHIVEKYKAAILNKTQRDGAYRKENRARRSLRKFFTSMVFAGIVVVAISGITSFLGVPGMFFFGAGLLLGGLVSFLFGRKVKTPLTPAGQKEYDKLAGLSKYMQEFSLMKEHEIPALVLWEDYMVFATAMGIADKVAEQLEISYPEFKAMQTNGFGATDFMILYFFSPSFRLMTGLNFVGNVANIIRSVQIAQRAMKAGEIAGKLGGIAGGGSGRGSGSSFHGGGGGFSGGGFGGRR